MSDNRNINKKWKLTAAELAAAVEHIASSSDDGSDISDFESSDESSSEGEDDGSVVDYESDSTVDYDHDVADEEAFHWNNAPQQVQQQLPFTGTPGINVQISATVEGDPLRLTARHFPSYVPATAKKVNAQRICAVCSSKKVDGRKVRKESRYECADCDVSLCAAPCFQIYHTIQNSDVKLI